jgi:hypothetical protein
MASSNIRALVPTHSLPAGAFGNFSSRINLPFLLSAQDGQRDLSYFGEPAFGEFRPKHAGL